MGPAAARVVLLGAAAALAMAGGCGGGRAVAEPGPGETPILAVQTFLEAAGRSDHSAMARLFGTATGPIADQGSALGCGLRRVGSWIGLGERCLAAAEIEVRMDLIARILAHESFRVGPSSGVVGRGRPATRVEVGLGVGGGRVVVVPFVVIRANSGRWLVAEVGLGRLTR